MLFIFSGQNWLGIHLGMSGNLRTEPPGFRAGKHDHLVLQQKKQALVFRDARQFGRVRFHHGKAAPAWWAAGGPRFIRRSSARRRCARSLGDTAVRQSRRFFFCRADFPGLATGWRTRFSGARRSRRGTKAGALSGKKLSALWRSVRFVARASLRTIGRDNSDPPKTWLLHERWKAGGKCPRHGTTLRRATIGGRTTAWCPRCQQ